LTKQTHSGSCLCGQVKFNVEGTFDSFYLCHCKYCQKDTGSIHAANLFSTAAKLTWMEGAEKVNTFNLPSTRHFKSFCRTCGAALPNLQMGGKLLVVPAGSLDTELVNQPNAHIFYSSRATWEKDLEKLKKFEEIPD